MQTAGRRRTKWAIAVSALAHAVLLVGALLHRPHLTSPVELTAGPAETLVPVIMTPRRRPSVASRPPESRPRSRQPASSSTSALPAPPQSLAATAPPAAAAPPGPAQTVEEGPDLRLALRHGAAGCASAAAVGMSRAERERCEDQLGSGAKTAPVMALAMEPRMRAYYDAVIKAKAPDKPWTPNRAIGALNRFDPEPRVSSSGDHIPAVGCVVPFGLPKMTAKEKQALKKRTLPHALWLGPCFIEPPKGSLDPEIDIPVP